MRLEVFAAVVAARSDQQNGARRDLWRQIFEHYVFSGGDAALEHLSERQRGIQGAPSPRIAQVMRDYLARSLQGKR